MTTNETTAQADAFLVNLQTVFTDREVVNNWVCTSPSLPGNKTRNTKRLHAMYRAEIVRRGLDTTAAEAAWDAQLQWVA